MTSEIHEAHIRWLNAEFQHMAWTRWLTPDEIELMDFGSPGPGAKKTADWICRANTDRFPRFLVEAGWTESFPQLGKDKDLWIRGTADVLHLQGNGSIGSLLQRVDRSMVSPSNYVILDPNRGPITIIVSPDREPRRIHSRSASSSQIARGRQHFLRYFRDGLRERDRACAITGQSFRLRDDPFNGLEAAHIYPVSRVSEWVAQNYRRWITDDSNAGRIGETGLYSLQNGLLLTANMHRTWDSFGVAVDLDADFKIVNFGEDTFEVGDGASETLPSTPEIQTAGNAGTPQWDYDLGPDNIGEILAKPGAAERMAAELFTRLAS
ncbi:HNH endonuclease domain containing protein [Elaphomyces granulatus]